MKHIEQLREILGPDVLLLGWPKGSKGTKRPWGHLTADKMGDPKYLAKLKTGNIGVALGAVSGGLCSIDIDSDEAARSFLERNPALQHTFRTRGRKGCNIWLRFSAEHPQRTRFLKSHGNPWGEFRSNGVQTIVWGVHPEGMAYEWLTRHPVLTVDFQSIVWPDGISGIKTTASSQNSKNGTIPQRDRGDRETEEVCVGVSAPSRSFSAVVYTAERVVKECLPTAPGMNHRRLFDLNRGVLALENQEGAKWNVQKRLALFDEWYAAAAKTEFLNKGQSKEDYRIEFMSSSSNIRYPLGADGLSEAIEKARNTEFPPEAAQFENPKIKLVIGICYQLQVAAGSEPFFISARSLAKPLEVDWSGCAKWLKALCAWEVIKLVEQGGTKTNPRKASRYRYKSLLT